MDLVLPDWVKPGSSFRDETAPDHATHRVWHVLAIVDGDHVVMKRWTAEHGGSWHYVVEGVSFFSVGRKLTKRR